MARLLGTSIHGLADVDVVRGHTIEVETDVEEGEEARIYAEVRAVGMSFSARRADGLVRSVHLHSAGLDGHDEYRGACPAGLSFGDNRATVRHRLGHPTRSGEPQEIHPFGLMPAWDRYDLTDAVVHIEYVTSGDGIRLITVMSEAP